MESSWPSQTSMVLCSLRIRNEGLALPDLIDGRDFHGYDVRFWISSAKLIAQRLFLATTSSTCFGLDSIGVRIVLAM